MIDFSDIEDNRLAGDSPLACAKLIELRMLRIFDRICQTYKLDYCLAYGTALGAVRHGGFIPWDDDIDVAMPLEDYNKFVKIAKEELPEGLCLRTKKDLKLGLGYGKIFDLKSFYVDGTAPVLKLDEPNGAFLDIFPLRPYRFGRVYLILTRMTRHAHRVASSIGEISAASLFRVCLWRMIKFLIVYPIDILLRSRNGRWACMPQVFGGNTGLVSIAAHFPSARIRFEGFEFSGPRDPHVYLKERYGDYMTLPPENQRYSHARVIVPLVS